MKSKNLALILLVSAMCVMTACTSKPTEQPPTDTTNNGTTTNQNEATPPTTGTNNTGKDTINDGSTILGSDYENGTYRGSYVDSDVNQLSIEFVIKDNKFESIKYRALTYKGENYLDEAATGVLKSVREQYQQAADSLIGKGIDTISTLYKPGDVVSDVDTVTGATLRTGKLISALWDGLNRHPYKLP